MSAPNAAKIISRCIEQVRAHRDGRGPWQAERACAQQLGGSSIDRHCAEAARRIGEWLRVVKP